MTGGKRKVGYNLEISWGRRRMLMDWIDEPQPDYLRNQCDELGGRMVWVYYMFSFAVAFGYDFSARSDREHISNQTAIQCHLLWWNVRYILCSATYNSRFSG